LAADAGLNEAQCVRDPIMTAARGMQNDVLSFEKMTSLSTEQVPANEVFKIPEEGASSSALEAEAGGSLAQSRADEDAGTFTYLGSFEEDCYYIKASNQDGLTLANEVQMTLKVAAPVTIYVCLPDGNEQRIEGLYKWSKTPIDGGASEHGWHHTNRVEGPQFQFGSTTHGGGMVFEKNFNQEEILLHGNDWRTNYLVFVCPQHTADCGEEEVESMFPHGAKAMNMNAPSGCDGTLREGASCSPECNEGSVGIPKGGVGYSAGFDAVGSISCTKNGARSTAKCVSRDEAEAKCSIEPPDYGEFQCAPGQVDSSLRKSGCPNAATCPYHGVIFEGEECLPACAPGYEASGKYSCYVTTASTDGQPKTAMSVATCDPVTSLLEGAEAPETPTNKKLMRSAMDDVKVHGN